MLREFCESAGVFRGRGSKASLIAHGIHLFQQLFFIILLRRLGIWRPHLVRHPTTKMSDACCEHFPFLTLEDRESERTLAFFAQILDSTRVLFEYRGVRL